RGLRRLPPRRGRLLPVPAARAGRTADHRDHRRRDQGQRRRATRRLRPPEAVMSRVVAALLLLAALPARAQSRVELYTMGPGDDLFEAFGHGALCVTSPALPKGRCYNYGTADFRDPAALIWRFLRGRAIFWVSTQPLPLMIDAYTAEDRTIYR